MNRLARAKGAFLDDARQGMPMKRSADDSVSRFDRGSWAALTYALAIGLGCLLYAVWAWRIPGDGWLLDGNPDGSQVTFQANLAGRPSPLQAGDTLLAVEGIALAALADRAHAFHALQPLPWPDGTSMRYTVLRGDQRLELDVPLYRVSPWTYQIGLMQTQGLLFLLQLASSLFFFGIGLLVFLLRPGERAAHALLILGTAFLFQAVPTVTGITTAFFPYPPPSVGFDYWSAAILPSMVYLVLAFPAPSWPMRRFPRLTPLVIYALPTFSLNLLFLINRNNRTGYEAASSLVYIGEALVTMLAVIVSLLYAALRLRGRVERAQLAWMGFGLLSFVLPGIGGWLLLFFGVLSPAGGGLLGSALSTVGWFLLPVCLAVAILRYRLFDIAIIIRRTLVYSALTLALGAVYLVSVVALQAMFVELTGQESTLAVVASTLAIAALFGPLRVWVQAFIDRRFFRKKYDARLVLAQFAARAQQESDVDLLAADMLATVDETLKPEQVRLWLVRR
jgi:hypothetical protein